jgi:hypothetical protein
VERMVTEIRRLVHAVASAERHNFSVGIHLQTGKVLEENRLQRVQPLYELGEFVSGPFARAAERAGWRREVVLVRTTDLRTAANAVMRWDRWNSQYKLMLSWEKGNDRSVENGEPYWAFRQWKPPAPSGSPHKDLMALLAGMDAATESVVALAVESDGSPPREAPEGADDPTAYRAAKEFLVEPFSDYKAICKALAKNSWIRTRRPSPKARRLFIHAGDWHEMLNRRTTTDPLEFTAETVDAAMNAAKEVDRRKREVDRQRVAIHDPRR